MVRQFRHEDLNSPYSVPGSTSDVSPQRSQTRRVDPRTTSEGETEDSDFYRDPKEVTLLLVRLAVTTSGPRGYRGRRPAGGMLMTLLRVTSLRLRRNLQ